MKTSLLTLALLAAPVAFAARTDVTTMDHETVISSSDMHYNTNSNDRFDNRDTRSNSTATPAHIGAEQSTLSPDISSNKYVAPSEDDRMVGSTTVDQSDVSTSNQSTQAAGSAINESETPSSMDDHTYSSDTHMSGSSTEPSGSSTTGATATGDTSSAAATGAAAGTAAGAAASPAHTEETTTTTETKTSKKAKKSHKSHKSGTSSDMSSSPSSSNVSPNSGSATDAAAAGTAAGVAADHTYDTRSGSSSTNAHSPSTNDMPSSSSTPGSTVGEKSTGSSSMGSANDTAGATAGAAAGSNSGKTTMGNESSDKTGLTAQDTARNKQETELVRKIRSEITDNKNLSTNAHNVKIISQGGQIYLKGPVADANEKEKLAEIAKRVAGNTTVINQTTIEARSGSSNK